MRPGLSRNDGERVQVADVMTPEWSGRSRGWREGARRSLVASCLCLWAASLEAQPIQTIDIAKLSTDQDLLRLQGSEGNGAFGVPVAGGHDLDGDGFTDLAMAAMIASPLGRTLAGAVYVLFGNGKVEGTFDTAVDSAEVLRILGDQAFENAGSEIWIDDVTGDGIGDLLICRQNYSPDTERQGAGALTIVAGGSALRDRANALQPIDLRSPPPGLSITTILGTEAGGRLGIWARTGDVTGDGVADLLIGADQETNGGQAHAGAAYLVRGGQRLAAGGFVDLAQWSQPSFALEGDVLRLVAGPALAHGHFGATVQVGDLDRNGRAEVAAAEALARAGASLQPPGGGAHATGGAPRGTIHIVWDSALQGPWLPEATISTADIPTLVTRIEGGAGNVAFGEEMHHEGDYDGDGKADLFVGDLEGSPPGNERAGIGSVFFAAEELVGMSLVRDQPPTGSRTTTFHGPAAGAIGADTALLGDFDGDGIDDLSFSAPHASPLGRPSAGQLYVFLGRAVWPELVDLRPGMEPPSDQLHLVSILGARGTVNADLGDTLAYSAATGDVDGDGRTDLITNEMLGNGASAAAVDTGNLIVLSGALIQGCHRDPKTLCLSGDRFEVTAHWQTTAQQGDAHAAALTADTGTFWFFDSGNVELIVKVLNGCSFNNRFWVFAAGLTNVGVRLEVRDTRPGATQIYGSANGSPFQPIQDTSAFVCP